MELDDLKSAWAQYDKKLEENLKFNEAILRKMNLNASRKQLRPIKIIWFIFTISSIYSLVKQSVQIYRFIQMDNLPDGTFLISGMSYVLTFAGLIYMIISLYSCFKIDFYGSSIMQIQKDIERIEIRRSLKTTVIAFVVLLVWIFTILILNFFSYKNMSDGSMLALLLWAIFTVVLCVLGVNLFRLYYNRKLKNIKCFLAEIEHFEKEE